MLGTNVGFVWPPHIQQCPTMLAFVGINVGIVWPGLILQFQLSFHPLICFLNDARVFMHLNSSGRLFQSLQPKKDKLSIP